MSISMQDNANTNYILRRGPTFFESIEDPSPSQSNYWRYSTNTAPFECSSIGCGGKYQRYF